ncbi:hypothetical protein KC460_02370 [Candidatus Dependentiae bacterium]|nr:hypothetical protein [Candidatus Dependentiae bacterium]
MVTLQGVSSIITIITLLIAYCISVAVAGAFRAWTAYKMGDETGQALGFLTLSPLAHIDLFGLAFLFVFQFGWGRHIPINPLNIHGPSRTLRMCAAYLSDTFAHLAVATIGMFTLLVGFGTRVLELVIPMVRFGVMSHTYIAQEYTASSSLAVSLMFIIIAIVYLNVVLAALSFIISGFGLLTIFLLERYPEYWRYRNYLFLLVPMLLILFFSYPLRLFVLWIISTIGFMLAYFVNLV